MNRFSVTESNHPTLLDIPISFFEYDHSRNTFANVPSQKTTLRRMITTHYYLAPIEQIRAEPDKAKQDELKKYLPAFTPAALLKHRKRNTSFAEKILQQWSMLMGDIDRKDNPDYDMAELKEDLSRLPYVLLCAYSVRGGLWFVVRLPDNQTPETLAAHFRYLQKLFDKKFDIKLDPTKGGNPTDLRFVSYDAAPFINENATIMTGTYTPPKPKPPPTLNRNTFQLSGEWELNQVVKLARTAQKGHRHNPLLKAATLAGGYVGAGRLDHDMALSALETIASELDSFRDSEQAIRDGLRYGMDKPIYEEVTYKQARSTPVAPSVCQSDAPRPQPDKSSFVPSPVESSPISSISLDQPENEGLPVAPLPIHLSNNRAWMPSAPFVWDGEATKRFIRYAVIPDGYDEQSWPPTN